MTEFIMPLKWDDWVVKEPIGEGAGSVFLVERESDGKTIQ